MYPVKALFRMGMMLLLVTINWLNVWFNNISWLVNCTELKPLFIVTNVEEIGVINAI